jgi:hypothetical protein
VVQDGQILAALGVAGEKNQRQDQGRVESCACNELEDGHGVEALARQKSLVHRHLRRGYILRWLVDKCRVLARGCVSSRQGYIKRRVR